MIRHGLLLGVLASLVLTMSAGADPTEDLRMCQAQSQIMAHQILLVRQIRDFYEARLAEALMRLEAAEAELANRPVPGGPQKP